MAAPNDRFFSEEEIVSPVKRLMEVRPLLGVDNIGGLSEFRYLKVLPPLLPPNCILIWGMAKHYY